MENFPLNEESREDTSHNFDDTLANVQTSLRISENGFETKAQNNSVGGLITDNWRGGAPKPKNTQKNPNITCVSILSPRKNEFLSASLEIIQALLGNRSMSNPTSSSSGRRLQLEAEVAAYQVRAKIKREQDEFDLRRRQR